MSSIEAIIAENTKAMVILTESLNKSNDLTERMIGLKSDAIETVKNVAAKPEAAAPKTTTAKATEAEKPAETKPAEAEKPKDAPMDPIAQAISDYVGAGYDQAHAKAAEERKARSAKVKEIFAVIAEKGGVEVKKHTDIPEKFHGAFLKTLAKRAEEGNLVIGKDSDDDMDLG